MSKGTTAGAVYRKDYTPYPWTLVQARFRFEIGPRHTRVMASLDFSPNPLAEDSGCIELDGENMELLSVSKNSARLEAEDYELNDEKLVVNGVDGACTIDLEVEISPQENTALEGLYPSGEFLLTQCEAEGFRKICYFPDRPDVMTTYDVTIVADRSSYPVLLSNGNAVDSGELENGRHWVRWVDPFAKPSYLFALVAGDLACVEDCFTTRSGREVVLRFMVEQENVDKCGHAMESLIKAMKWDEERFDLEYDLDIYHVVATNDFNMGAMENKSLNIFNSKYVLASPETATDSDYEGIEGVIGHEYFHNWTGNRVTCQDWFQLTLKEGLTVFRDQEFTSDLQSRAVKRIQDVRILRSRQFPEDAGPMSHPIRPDKFHEINNFYTMTVYQKGSEIIRMYHTLLGEDGFQAGMKLYFERHDGHAVTCDDFLAAMADANGVDLGLFSRWYGQSGTPVVTARGDYDPASRRYTLFLSQSTPVTHDQSEKQPLFIPVLAGLLTHDGRELELTVAGSKNVSQTTVLLLLDDEKKEFVFENVPEPPVPSLLRDYSAPVRLEFDYTSEDFAVLMAHDSNPFTRWEAGQQLAQQAVLSNVKRRADGEGLVLPEELESAFRTLLEDQGADPGLLAEAITLPGEDYLAELVDVVDVDGIHAARSFVKSRLASRLHAQLEQRYRSLANEGPYDKSQRAIGRRSLRNACLSYLLETDAGPGLAETQLQSSNNMTDTLAALSGLVWKKTPSSVLALAEFEQRWKNDALVMDKWFSIQASVPGVEAVNAVVSLMEHPAFSIRNPNKVRSLVGVFSTLNPTGFHAESGAGYRFLADCVIELDGINPQIAARTAGAFNQWTRYDDKRRRLMKAELERIAAVESLSGDVAEIVRNALAMGEESTH